MAGWGENNHDILHIACSWVKLRLPYPPVSTNSRYKDGLRSMSLSPAINDMCRYWGEIWRQLEILLVSALATYCLHFFWSFFSANFRGRYLGNRLSELLQIWFGKGPDIGQYAHQISSNSDKPFPRYWRRKLAEKTIRKKRQSRVVNLLLLPVINDRCRYFAWG